MKSKSNPTPKKYVRVKYNEEQDAFVLEGSIDGGKTFNMYVTCKCFPLPEEVRIQAIDCVDERPLIDYRILTELIKAVNLGYTLLPEHW